MRFLQNKTKNLKTRVIFLTEIISPYRIPFFNEIARVFKDKFLVLFLGESEKRRKWKIYKEKIKFRYEILPGILLQGRDSAPYFLNFTLISRLIKHSADIIVIGGYHQPGSLMALLYAKFFKRRCMLWCESNKNDLRTRHFINEAYKRWFVRRCDGFIVPGKASFEYLVSLGARPKEISIAPNAIDNDYFSLASAKYKEDSEAIRKSKGYPKKNILFVGRLIEEKGIFDLFKSFQIVSREESNLGLLIVGSGKAEKECREFCRINNLQSVFFTGFLQQEELPVYYAIADCFVLPTHSDPWGLVLNEAMSCGLPVISSDAAGAALDLVRPELNGYIFKRGDVSGLADCLRNILNDEGRRFRMGRVSLDIIKNYSPLKSAERFIQATGEA
jgi:glycosyltransferase involved in cell wall biosynthesis